MHDALAVEPPQPRRFPLSLTSVRAGVPSLRETALSASSAFLCVLAFPNIDLWWLAWIGLAPLIFVIARTNKAFTAFVLGWLWGTIFFYGTCWWLTYPMIHYGHVPTVLAYVLLVLPIIFVAAFPGLACAFLSRVITRFGAAGVFLAPLIWVAFEWLRYPTTGQIWNALGYSQAFHPFFIHPAKWGGVYAVSFLIVTVNAAIAFAVIRRTIGGAVASAVILFLVMVALLGPNMIASRQLERPVLGPALLIVAVQPNVPMEGLDDKAMQQLLKRHLELSLQGLSTSSPQLNVQRLVIWPESPMNFVYSRDPQLQQVVTSLAQTNHTAVLLNSLEPAPKGGGHNSALLINEEGRIAAQYDKIRLMPFGEYVPLPRWLPGSGSVRSIVGEFTPGNSHTLMPLGAFRAGVFICIEASHPEIARTFTNTGAEVLINISNDGYLGTTPVMRQHLANAIFRAVENDRDLIRVTNSGISAFIGADGSVHDATNGFQEAVRIWTVSSRGGATFYSRRGDLFVYACALIALGVISATFMRTGSQYRER